MPEARELAEMVTPDLRERGYDVFIVSAVAHLGRAGMDVCPRAGCRGRAGREVASEIVPQRIVIRPKSDDKGFTHRAGDDR